MMDNLKQIIEDTKNGRLHWQKNGDANSFTAYSDDNYLYSVVELGNGCKVFDGIDADGKIIGQIISRDADETDWAGLLYESIIEASPELCKSVDSSVSLTTIKERLLGGIKINTNSDSSFTIFETRKTYVEPKFSQQITFNGMMPLKDAQVIAISASGATGKTALTEHLSSSLKIPVFDMQRHPAVGSNSLLGMLFDTLSIQDFTSYIQSLKEGKATMIVDALDEGFVKTNNSAFESFLNDIVNISAENTGLPFVIMGRTSIVEYATMYLEERGVRVSMLQIEPFVRKKAEEFIDTVLVEKRGKEITYQKEYREARNYILDSLQAFFQKESDISRQQSQRFIGYAPVLLSIATLMHEKEQNYYQLKADLEKSNAKSINLICNIIEMILKREQNKVTNEIRDLLQETQYKDIDGIIGRCYDITEQCIRIVRHAIGEEYNEKLTGDSVIDDKYEELIGRWFKEHPFIVGNKIQNIVFEGYIVSKLINNEKYKEDVMAYLNANWRNSYILFDLYNIIAGADRRIDKRFVKYLIDSYKATEKGYNRHFVELTAISGQGSNAIDCELDFEKISDVECEPYVLTLQKDDILEMPASLSNAYIDIPACITFDSKHTELSPMININCRKIIMPSEDILITPARNDNSIILECEKFECEESGKLQTITNSGRVILAILTDSNLYFPFASYKMSRCGKIPEEDTFIDKYQKMRRTIVQFRAHSKGSLAKYKEKIDNRIGNTEIGKRVINGLLKEGILEEKNQMYFINDQKLSEKLGLGYNELRTYEINDKVTSFLNSI